MTSLHPSLLAALAAERVRTTRPVRARRPRRQRLADRPTAPVWGGGRTVDPCLAGCF